jgi:Flp pilus assembly protein TadD
MIDDMEMGDLKQIGRELAKKGQFRPAIKALLKVATADPSDVATLDALGFCYYMSGCFEEARAYCERSLAIRPENYYAHKGLGLCLARLGEPEAGLAELRKAVTLKPDDFDCHYDLAVTLTELGRWEEARGRLRQALDLEPGKKELVDQALRRIDALERAQRQ